MASSDQSTQYNTIVSAYASFYPSHGKSSLPCAELEEAQIHAVLTKPGIDIKGKRILELACGNGFYSTRFLEWGAESVTGVDISESMLAAAKQSAADREIPETKLRFVLGDVTSSDLKVEGGFDIVTSEWLLNYAPGTSTMTKMWNTVARHLKPGGVFVGLTIPPLLTARGGQETLAQEAVVVGDALGPDGVWGRYGNGGLVLGVVEEGLSIRMELGMKDQGQELAVFDCYYLGYESFENSIKASTLDGRQAFDGIEWQDFVVPDAIKEGKPVGYWNAAAISPTCRVCVAQRCSA